MSGVDIDALEGWLEKEKSRGKFAFLGDTNKRWFKVQTVEGQSGSELTLCYFRSNKDTQPRGWIYLSDVLEVHDSLNKLTLITSTRELRLRAATRAEQRLWSKSLKQLCPTARVLGSPDSDDLKQAPELKEPIDVQRYSPRAEPPRQQLARAAAKETSSAAPRSDKTDGPSRTTSAASSRSGTPTTNGSHAGAQPMTTRGEPRHGTSTSTRLHQHIAERHDSDADRKATDVPNDIKSQPLPSPFRSDISEVEELEDIAVPAATRVTTVASPRAARNAQAPAIVRSESKQLGGSDTKPALPRTASGKEVTDFPIVRRVGSFADDSSDEDEEELDLEAEKARLVARAQAKAREEEQQRTLAVVSKTSATSTGRPPLPSKAKLTAASPQPISTTTAPASSSSSSSSSFSGGGGSGVARSVGTPPPFKRAYDPGVTPDEEFADDDWDQEDEAPVAKTATTREKKKDSQFGGYAGGVKPDENWLDEDFDD